MRIKIHVLTVSLRFLSGFVLIGAFVAAYVEEKRLVQSGQSQNKFSRKMTFGEAKKTAVPPKEHISSVSSRINILPNDNRNKTEHDGKEYTVSNGSTTGSDNVSGVRLNPMSTRL